MSSWKKETAQDATAMAQQQFAYQQKLINQREAERTAAMGQMESLMKNPPTYQIPAQVQQYTNLMNVLGGQLYGLQDASGGAKSIDASQYASQSTQSDPWESNAKPFNPVVPSGDANGSGGGSTGRRKEGDVSPTTQGRPGNTTNPPVNNGRTNSRTQSGRRN